MWVPGVLKFLCPFYVHKRRIVIELGSRRRAAGSGNNGEGNPDMNSKSRILRGALLSVTVALAVSAVPAAGATANAGDEVGQHAILKKAILKKAIL